MTAKTEAIREARLAVTTAQAKVADLEKQVTESEANAAKVRALTEVLRKRAARRPIALTRPGGTILHPGMNLNRGYVSAELVAEYKGNVKKWTEAVATGVVGVALPEGTTMKAKGYAQRARYVSPASMRKIKAAERRKVAAANAYTAASKAYQSAIEAAWSDGETVTVDEVADLMGRFYAVRAQHESAPMSWVIESAKRRVEEAQKHLAALQGKGECNCGVCWGARREVEDAARAKKIAAMPRVRYTCPRCAHEVVAIEQATPEGRKAVSCPRQECRGVALMEAIKVRRVAKSTPIGEVRKEAA